MGPSKKKQKEKRKKKSELRERMQSQRPMTEGYFALGPAPGQAKRQDFVAGAWAGVRARNQKKPLSLHEMSGNLDANGANYEIRV